jgi:hypothetical protein
MPSGTVAPHRTASPLLERTGTRIRVRADSYSLEIPDSAVALVRAPIARLRDASGRRWSDLSLLSSAHTRGASDETVRVVGIEVQQTMDAVELRIVASSSVWSRRDLVLRCTSDGLEAHIELRGTGLLTGVTIFGGRGAMPNAASGEFRSDIRFAGVLAPAATEPVQLVRPSTTPAALSVIGDADAGRLHAVFSPPPLALGLSRRRPRDATVPPDGEWMGLWVRSPVEQLTMTAMRYLPLDGGFLVQLDYEGHTEVDGSWTSPTFVLQPAASGWDVLDAYRKDLVEHGMAPAAGPTPAPGWWREPIFCGWGAQCARSAHDLHGDAGPDDVDGTAETSDDEVATVHAAPSFAREDVYDQFLGRLVEHGLEPGTIVIDDRWQSSYGTGEVDTAHWPDLRRWIDARHAEGRKVLLWWKAWDAEGIPAEECVSNAAGEPISVDAGSESYRRRLAGVIHRLLSTEGLDADGLKIDFTQRGPSGESLTGTPGVWGIAALHLLLSTIADAARGAKPDALLIAHAVHPSFADVCSMVRLNDVSKRDPRRRRVPVVDQLAMRHGIASRVLPHHAIDTDQWPMPNRAEWLSYAEAQPQFGVPALYYVEAIDRSGERIHSEDLRRIAESWRRYRAELA